MGNFGDLTLKVYDQDLSLLATYTNVIAGDGISALNRAGNGECTLKVQTTQTGLTRGNIAVCYIADAIGGVDLSVCKFTIEEIHYKTSADGMSEIRMSGRDLLGELTGYKHFVDIGDTYATALGDAMGALDDEFVPQSGNVGSVSVTLTTQDRHATIDDDFYCAGAEVFTVGDDLAGESEGLNNQISVVEAIDIDGYAAGVDIVTMRDAWVAGSDIGNKVFIPEIYKGDSIIIELDGAGGDHYTRITNDPGPEQIKIEEGIPAGEAAASGNTVTVISGQTPVTTDVYDIMELARLNAGWALDSSAAGTPGGGTDGGTASPGTSHTVDGANTLQLLINTNELTSEWFRLSEGTPQTAVRSIDWRASSDATGIQLTMPAVQATVHSDYQLTARGIMQGLTAETRWKIATAVVAKGATDNFNLGHKTDADVGDFRTELVKGKWRVTNDALSLDDYTYVHYVTFSGVKEKSDSYASITAAANELYKQARLYLDANDSTEEFVQVKGAMLHSDVLPGQGIALNYSEGTPPIWTNSRTVYIVEVHHSVGADGVRYTDLICSETAPYNRDTIENKLLNQTSAGSATSSAGASGGGGTGASHDPVTIGTSDPAGALSITGQVLSFQMTPGDGLTSSANVLSVELPTDSGLNLATGALGVRGLEMGTPSTLTAATSNSVTTTTHAHEVETTNDPISNPSEIVATDANSRTGFSGLGVGQLADADELQVAATLSFIGAQTIDTTSGDLTIAPAGDIFIDAAGDNMQFDQHVDPQGESYSAAGASAFTAQWKIDTELGAGYFAYLEADQMHIRLFQADVTMAKANGMIVTDSVAVLSADFTVPNVSSSTTIIVDDNPALGAAQVFQDDDWVRMRVFERDSGLDLFDLWGQVDTYSDNGDGTQDWTFNCEYAGPPGAGDPAEGLTVQAGGTVLGYGKSGQGWWEVDARRNEGPFTRIGTWSGTDPYTAANRSVNLMTGRLLSLTGNDEYGFYAGVSIDGPHVLITERTAEFQDIDISMRTGTPDGGYIRVYALELNSDIESAIAPNGTFSDDEVNHGGTGSGDLHTSIDNNPASGQPDADWIYSTPSSSAHAWFSMEDISHTLTTLSVEAYCTHHNLFDDTCQLRAQMFKEDGVTVLTDEIKVFTESTTQGLVTVPFTGIVTATDGEWAAARLKLTWVYFTVGSDEVLTIKPDAGIDVVIEDSSDYSGHRAITLSDTNGAEVGGLYGRFSSGNSYYLRLGTNEANFASGLTIDDSDMYLMIENFAETPNEASTEIRSFVADAGAIDQGADLRLVATASTNYISMSTGRVLISGGLSVGDITSSPDSGQLILDQGDGDGLIFKTISSDFTDGVAQGMDDGNTYFQLGKASATLGGAQIKGAGESTYGTFIIGSASTATSTTSTAALAPVIIRGQVDDGAVGSGNNVLVVQNDSGGTQLILKGDGDLHINGTYETWDAYDDVAMIRAASLLSPNAIRTTFDDMVQYNRDDLEAAGLVSGTFVNTTGFMRLHSGAIWQLHKRIAELESEIKEWKTNDNRH